MNRVSIEQVHKMLILSSSLFPKTVINKEAMLLMLLNLMDKKNGMAVTSLCYGSCVTPTTALRYIDFLEKHGWIERSHDDGDHRRKIVTLTTEGSRIVTDYIMRVSDIFAKN